MLFSKLRTNLKKREHIKDLLKINQCYFEEKGKLVYIKERADSLYWDSRWETMGDKYMEIAKTKRTFVTDMVEKYLKPSNGIIFEGGCGTGRHVAALRNAGYTCVGMDFAENTVKALNDYAPILDIRLGDVSALPFPDDHFIGYLSLGVIEHFWDGYEQILKEMARVIKTNGFLFVSFPYLSPLRKRKINWGLYRKCRNSEIERFYQFALDKDEIIHKFSEFGFRAIKEIPLLPHIGFLQEILRIDVTPVASRIYYRLLNKLLKILLSRVRFCCHSILIVFERLSAKTETLE